MNVKEMDSAIKRLLHLRNQEIFSSVRDMKMREKRRAFAMLRKTSPLEDMNYVFPDTGLTVGEFCTAHVLQTAKQKPH